MLVNANFLSFFEHVMKTDDRFFTLLFSLFHSIFARVIWVNLRLRSLIYVFTLKVAIIWVFWVLIMLFDSLLSFHVRLLNFLLIDNVYFAFWGFRLLTFVTIKFFVFFSMIKVFFFTSVAVNKVNVIDFAWFYLIKLLTVFIVIWIVFFVQIINFFS